MLKRQLIITCSSNRYCVDCVHFRKGTFDHPDFGRCVRPEAPKLNLVTGITHFPTKNQYASVERGDYNDTCGPSANYYQHQENSLIRIYNRHSICWVL